MRLKHKNIDDYIKTNKIPLSFLWKDGYTYDLECCVDGFLTNFISPSMERSYPNWMFKEYNITETTINYYSYIADNFIFLSTNIIIDKCLSDFYIWWEINKNCCKSIEYYDK